jgi:hypothetical protein
MLSETAKADIIIFENAVSSGPDNSGNIHRPLKLIVGD